MRKLLLFVDTNIYLDSYRTSKEAGLSLLRKLEGQSDTLITTDQVWMEYCKNRQDVILQYRKQLDKPKSFAIPAFLSEAKMTSVLDANLKETGARIDKLYSKLSKAIANPESHDPVYNILRGLFAGRTEIALTRDKKVRFKLRSLARKRFMLGYPPRKPGDTSIGDAINWEWIVECSNMTGRGVVIVSRDSDYGYHFGDSSALNDWLKIEFKERTATRRRILFTNRLSTAFRYISVPTSKREREAEEETLGPLPPPLPIQPISLPPLQVPGLVNLPQSGAAGTSDPSTMLSRFMQDAKERDRQWKDFLEMIEKGRKLSENDPEKNEDLSSS